MTVSGMAGAAVCDVDEDGDVDRQDISLIISARDRPADGSRDARDPDGDGNITVFDARTCIRRCNLPDCKVVSPVPPAATDSSDQIEAPKAAPIQNDAQNAGKSGSAAAAQPGTEIQGRSIVRGTEWKVKRGDTLYAIGRAIFPGNGNKQARLRQDIIELNPAVFANGANNMAVGVVLKLPDYVIPKVAPVEVTPEPKLAVPAPVVEPEPETPRQVSPFFVRTDANYLVSLGYAYGGDKLVYEDGSYDPAGAAFHGRLGYEQMYQRIGGYRVALGLQYGLTEDSTFRDVYLQLAYQYRSNPFIYGIGVVVHDGPTIEDDSTIEYDAANGVVVYLENVGNSDLAGWGLSYTFLDIEDKDSSESFDASRAELYYSWRF
ncbi:MAG: hypothetical protein KJP11_08390 [Gammaproteobacteria bacterium]|nr:hypothetical protein [Gammaproteobacteria bacterium]